MRSYWSKVGPPSNRIDVFIRRWPYENTNTGRMPFDNGGRDWSYPTTSQGTPGLTEARKKQGRILPHRLLRDFDPVNTLISDV